MDICSLCKRKKGSIKITMILTSSGFSRTKKILICGKCHDNILKAKNYQENMF